ncbi:MAG: dUTP diphosphatase [Candidatus Hodarchaeales archaeon]
MKLKVKKIDEKAQIPTKHNPNDAAFDLYAVNDILIPAGTTEIVHTGICIEIPAGNFGKIESRSSLAKRGIFCTAGVIDSGYRGEVMIVMNNMSQENYSLKQGDRIAQMIIHKVENFEIVASENLDENLDRGGGFGSSGK